MIHIRNAHPDDLPAVVSVQQHCYGEHFPESAESLRSKLTATPSTCWLALRDDEAMGYLITLPVDQISFPTFNAPTFELCADPELFYIHDLAVTPTGRSLNIGRQLLMRALAAAQASAIPRAALIAVQASTAYWTRHGFDLVATPPPELLTKLASFGTDARYMEKQLHQTG